MSLSNTVELAIFIAISRFTQELLREVPPHNGQVGRDCWSGTSSLSGPGCVLHRRRKECVLAHLNLPAWPPTGWRVSNRLLVKPLSRIHISNMIAAPVLKCSSLDYKMMSGCFLPYIMDTDIWTTPQQSLIHSTYHLCTTYLEPVFWQHYTPRSIITRYSN